jgi:hypothetical protein
MKSVKIPQNTVVAPISTGLGIVLGNWVINSWKYRNLIKDISKIFDLVVSNQIDDLYNIRMACERIRNRLTTHTLTIICSQNAPNIVPESPRTRTTEERRGLLQDREMIEHLENTIRNDKLYNGMLDDIKSFKFSDLEILVRYFRQLKVALEHLKNFTSYELPSSIDKFDNFDESSSERCKNRTKFLIARINISICLGLITKPIFGRFDIKAQKNFSEVYQGLCILKPEIDSENDYSLLKENFNVIQEFAQRNGIECNKPANSTLIAIAYSKLFNR